MDASKPWKRMVPDFAVVGLACLVALVSARSYAGCWNDGSRLATVECLVDYGTLAIDDSIFVRVPSEQSPYRPDDDGLRLRGTGDKLLIDGRFYSDKSPVPALYLAAVYRALQATTGLLARERPGLFVLSMTLASSGLAYVVAIWCIFRMGAIVGLSLAGRLTLTASFALGSIALPYVRHVNNHELLLGAASALMLGLAKLTCQSPTWWRTLGMGSLAGLGYVIDLGAGPVLVLCATALVAYRCRAVKPLAAFGLGALPWLVLHHAVNYAVGGTIKPANAVPDYFLWEGCTFTAKTLTGSWNHRSVGHFLLYAADLLVGRRGFLGHDLPLFLALIAGVSLLLRRVPEWPEVAFAACWSGGTWLAYALTSNNLSGQCCSIRWFVPLLAPGYFLLSVLLKRRPETWPVFLALAGWCVPIALLAWWEGPWMRHMVPCYWALMAGGLTTSVIATRWYRKPVRSSRRADPKVRAA